ncbi:MAG: hypothetical protein V4724_26620 [Pseudomonadota bacterium]
MSTQRMTKEEFLACFAPPPEHADDMVIMVKGLPVWKRRADIDGSEGAVFFDGDYRDVLEPDDPRVRA